MDSSEVLAGVALATVLLRQILPQSATQQLRSLFKSPAVAIEKRGGEEEEKEEQLPAAITTMRISRSLAQPCCATVIPKLIVFDLDLTLIGPTAIESLNVRHISKKRRAASFYDPEFLRSFCELCLSRGHQVRIATMAEPAKEGNIAGESADEVILLLDSVLPRQRRYLNDRAHIACWRSNQGKNTHIEQILRSTLESEEGNFSPSQVFLLDDCPCNIRQAESSGYEGFLVTNPQSVVRGRNNNGSGGNKRPSGGLVCRDGGGRSFDSTMMLQRKSSSSSDVGSPLVPATGASISSPSLNNAGGDLCNRSSAGGVHNVGQEARDLLSPSSSASPAIPATPSGGRGGGSVSRLGSSLAAIPLAMSESIMSDAPPGLEAEVILLPGVSAIRANSSRDTSTRSTPSPSPAKDDQSIASRRAGGVNGITTATGMTMSYLEEPTFTRPQPTVTPPPPPPAASMYYSSFSSPTMMDNNNNTTTTAASSPTNTPPTSTVGFCSEWYASQEKLQFLLGIFDGDVAAHTLSTRGAATT